MPATAPRAALLTVAVAAALSLLTASSALAAGTTVTLGPLPAQQQAGLPLVVGFTADAEGATFTCAVDDRAPRPCTTGWEVDGLALGDHTLTVVARDACGAAGPPATAHVEVVGPLHPPVIVPDPPAGPPAPGAAAAPAAPDDVRMTTDGLEADPIVRAVTTGGGSHATVRRLAGGRAVVRVTLHARRGTRVARLVLRGRHGSTAVVLRAHGGTLHVRWRLSRAQVRGLGAGTARLTVTLGAARRSLSTAWSGGVRVPSGS